MTTPENRDRCREFVRSLMSEAQRHERHRKGAGLWGWLRAVWRYLKFGTQGE